MQNASDAGVLSQLLQLPVVLESIALTDVPNDAAILAGHLLSPTARSNIFIYYNKNIYNII